MSAGAGRETATPVEVPWTGDAWLGPLLTCLACNTSPEDLEKWPEDDIKHFDLTLICKTCMDQSDPDGVTALTFRSDRMCATAAAPPSGLSRVRMCSARRKVQVVVLEAADLLRDRAHAEEDLSLIHI